MHQWGEWTVHTVRVLSQITPTFYVGYDIRYQKVAYKGKGVYKESEDSTGVDEI